MSFNTYCLESLNNRRQDSYNYWKEVDKNIVVDLSYEMKYIIFQINQNKAIHENWI